MLQNEPFFAKFRFDTSENELSEVEILTSSRDVKYFQLIGDE